MPCSWKATVGLASHWSRVADINGSPPTGSRPRRGRWASAYALLWSTVDFTFLPFCDQLQAKLSRVQTLVANGEAGSDSRDSFNDGGTGSEAEAGGSGGEKSQQVGPKSHMSLLDQHSKLKLEALGKWQCAHYKIAVLSAVTRSRFSVAPCGLRGCKNRPAPCPGQMSYKVTKPGSVCPVS